MKRDTSHDYRNGATMAQYYTRRRIDGVYSELFGPFDSYRDAMGEHTDYLMRTTQQAMQMQTLLDVATVIGDEQQMIRLLKDDPVLAAIFNLGRRAGHQDANLGMTNPSSKADRPTQQPTDTPQ